MPEDLAEKRAKQAARAAKKEERETQPSAPKKNGTSARKKKLEKQLEGLTLAEKLVEELLAGGLDTLAGASPQSLEKVAKELGNYYLTGPQNAFTRMALTVRKIRQDPENARQYYDQALRLLVSLHAVIGKSRAFLGEKLEHTRFSPEESVLYEALGGVWRLEELKSIGAFREKVRLVQLSFDVSLDDAKKEYVERSFWMELDSGTICQTLNYRPLKALKYVKAEDSCFDLVEVPMLYEYPGGLNRRVRWEGCSVRSLTKQEREALPALGAEGIGENVRLAKGQMKNTLMPKWIPALLPVGRIGFVGNVPVLEDPAGERIVLRDRQEDGTDHRSVARLLAYPGTISRGSSLFGLMFYDGADRRICFHPYSVVTPLDVIRLQY